MKKLVTNFIYSFLTLTLCGASLARPKDFRKLIRTGSDFVSKPNKMVPARGEPTCEELKAVWRYSKRQSKASEVTNEIPTYRDPLAYNNWEQYPKARSAFGSYVPVRSWLRPVYRRMVKPAPSNVPRVLAENRAFEEVLRYDYGNPGEKLRSRPQASTYRLSGGQVSPFSLSPTGAFERLKEFIWAERVKELQQQRLLEESSTKSIAIKNPQQYNEDSQEQDSDYNKYIDQDPKGSKLRFPNSNTNFDAAYAPDIYRTPYRQRMAFNSESSNEKLW